MKITIDMWRYNELLEISTKYDQLFLFLMDYTNLYNTLSIIDRDKFDELFAELKENERKLEGEGK